MNKLSHLDQYRKDIFTKMELPLKKGLKILDMGCGDGQDCEVFSDIFKLKVYGVDVMPNPGLQKKFHYKKASIYKIPYKDNFFDYIFLHNVLHHIDEPKQRMTQHIKAMNELKRVCKKNGMIFILEGNRFNTLFYPHMVLLKGHDHFTQRYFYNLLKSSFKEFKIRHFEAHFYPQKFILIFKLYEKFMEYLSPKSFKAYNFGIIKNVK